MYSHRRRVIDTDTDIDTDIDTDTIRVSPEFGDPGCSVSDAVSRAHQVRYITRR